MISIFIENVNANKKGSGSKEMVHDEGHQHHSDVGRDGKTPGALKNRHRDHSSSSHHDGKHKSKKHRKNKHHKHRDGKKHHSPGKNQQEHHHHH
jgi:hypothetical protein